MVSYTPNVRKMKEYKLTNYSKKLKDPRWQKKRLEILERDNWTCQNCKDKETCLHVHHIYYDPALDPWDAKNEHLITLCEDCHEAETLELKEFPKLLTSTLKEKGFMANDFLELAGAFHAINFDGYKATFVVEIISNLIVLYPNELAQHFLKNITGVPELYIEKYKKNGEKIS